MNLHYAFPAVAAMAVHAILVLGFNAKSPMAETISRVELIAPLPPFHNTPEEEEKVSPPDADEPKPKKGDTEVSPPVTDEPPVLDIRRDQPTMATVPPIETNFRSHDVVPRGTIGVPDGDEYGKTLRNVPIFGSGELDRKPVTKVQVAPVYPAMAKVSGLTGEVLVEFMVDEQGRVLSPRVLRSTDRMFEEPTLAAVSKWRFERGMKNGRPVRFKMAVPVIFSLNQ